MNKTKKAVILNDISSPYIQQAIIILKEYDPEMESKILSDAEKVVSDYLHRSSSLYNTPAKKKKHTLRAFFLILSALLIGAIFFIIYK